MNNNSENNNMKNDVQFSQADRSDMVTRSEPEGLIQVRLF